VGDPATTVRVRGALLPGMPNVHSHAFQRAFAGLTGTVTAGGDSFWSWREAMYRFVERLGPDEIEAIAAQLYVEMLEAGYTGVAEFHYLHHAAGGARYANPAETSERIVAAAATAGIALTLLPVFYAHGGFGGAAPAAAQARFLHDVDGYLALLERLRPVTRAGDVRLGAAPHSLRAATLPEIRSIASGVRALEPHAVLHVHLAEQRREVSDCIAWNGRRPARTLLDEVEVGREWCLVHATQADADEVAAIAASGAVVGLCPTTEADLGDGIFPAETYLAAGGAFGIGSDSHVAVDPFEELRLLEYGQRLQGGRRNVLAAEGRPVGRRLYESALAGGARALARETGRIAPGARADLVVLDTVSPALAGVAPEHLLDAAVFGPARGLVCEVYVAGRRVVADGRHVGREAVGAGYRRALEQSAANARRPAASARRPEADA
jgi:formimidoylglutamate deiminase